MSNPWARVAGGIVCLSDEAAEMVRGGMHRLRTHDPVLRDMGLRQAPALRGIPGDPLPGWFIVDRGSPGAPITYPRARWVYGC